MEVLSGLPTWLLALLIFSVRIVDVSIGTLRTISVVHGRLKLSVILGFFEVSIWILALSQVIIGVSKSPLLILAYAAGFAAGNAVGIALERSLAMGVIVVRIISSSAGFKIAELLRREGQRATTFQGEGRDGPVILIYATCQRRALPRLLTLARQADPKLFYAVEPVQQWSNRLAEPLSHATLWQGMAKRGSRDGCDRPLAA